MAYLYVIHPSPPGLVNQLGHELLNRPDDGARLRREDGAGALRYRRRPVRVPVITDLIYSLHFTALLSPPPLRRDYYPRVRRRY